LAGSESKADKVEDVSSNPTIIIASADQNRRGPNLLTSLINLVIKRTIYL